jgi:hypothetical protein
MSMDTIARRFFPCVDVDDADARAVAVGRAIEQTLPVRGPVAVLGPGGEFLALYEHRVGETDGPARAVAVFV